MDLPGAARSVVGDESVAARVELGGEDLLLVTPTRTVVYRAEGLLSDESVAEYDHDVERIAVEESRRKATLRLDYGTDGERTLSLPRSRVDDALHPMMAGVLAAAGVADSGETVTNTFRFSELTVVVTSARLVKHVGSTAWDGGYEEYPYADVTDLRFEAGDHGTAVVLVTGDRQERFKAPNDRARELREALVGAVLDYHGHDELESFRAARAADTAESSGDDGMAVEGLSPLGGDDESTSAGGAGEEATGPPALDVVGGETAPADDGSADAAPDLAAEVSALREEVARQREAVEAQRELLDQLIEELRRGR